MPRDYQDLSPTALQRLPEYERDDEWISAFLREAKVGHIASARDNQPFLNPSKFWFDEANHQIIFHSNVAGRMRSNIEHNSRVCFEASELGKRSRSKNGAGRKIGRTAPTNPMNGPHWMKSGLSNVAAQHLATLTACKRKLNIV